MSVTKKQCVASAKQCEELLAKYNAIKEKFNTTKMELSRSKEKASQMQAEVETCHQEMLASRQVYEECLAMHKEEKRRHTTAAVETKESLSRLKVQIQVAEAKLSDFDEANDSEGESTMREQLIDLRNDYNELIHEKYLRLSKLGTSRDDLSTGYRKKCAKLEFRALRDSYESLRHRLSILNEECEALSNEELCLKLEALNALEEYQIAKKEHETLVECCKKSTKKKQPPRTCSKTAKKKGMCKTKKNSKSKAKKKSP